VGDQRARADHRALADFDSAHDYRAAADRGGPAHPRAFHRPMLFGFQRALPVGGARMAVVDEDHTVADKYFVLDLDPGADKAVAGNLAAPANACAALDFDERADDGLVADAAAVKIDEG
jgi:hypothetical protein